MPSQLLAKLLFLIMSLCVSAAVSAPSAPAPCADTDRECAFKASRDHIVKKHAFWRQALTLPLTDRVGAAAPELIDFLRLDTIAQAIPNRPHASSLTPEFISEVTAALAELPLLHDVELISLVVTAC